MTPSEEKKLERDKQLYCYACLRETLLELRSNPDIRTHQVLLTASRYLHAYDLMNKSALDGLQDTIDRHTMSLEGETFGYFDKLPHGTLQDITRLMRWLPIGFEGAELRGVRHALRRILDRRLAIFDADLFRRNTSFTDHPLYQERGAW
jgi:hypothetical protein